MHKKLLLNLLQTYLPSKNIFSLGLKGNLSLLYHEYVRYAYEYYPPPQILLKIQGVDIYIYIYECKLKTT